MLKWRDNGIPRISYSRKNLIPNATENILSKQEGYPKYIIFSIQYKQDDKIENIQ